jgi:signal transduction histidine kinase
MTARLPVRLFASYVLVVAVGAATVFLVVRLLAPPLFDHSMRGTGGAGMGGMGMGAQGGAHAAVVSAVNTALLVAVLASVAAGALVAAFVTGRLLRPLDAVRAATRRIAAGDYQATVLLPREPELAALAADVNTLAGTLADIETRRTRLLGDVAHEMRTPLTALDGYIEAFIDRVFTPDAENLQAMSEELHRLQRLADDLSALSRTQERRLDLRPVDADLTEITRRACGRLQPQFSDAGVDLTIQAPTAVPVCVDVDRITQVLTNLLGNALLATPAGGAVTVTVRADGDHAITAVTDSGVGFASDDRERIFERFYRATNRQRRSPGSGVGLTIARGLARAHGGDLRANSPGPGHGATFTLTLTRNADSARDAPHAR